MSTSTLALLISILVVVGFVLSLGGLSLFLGVLSRYLEVPKLTFLKASGNHGFAFALRWNSAKDVGRLDYVKVSLYNPMGTPTRLEVIRTFAPQESSFAQEVNMGETFVKILGAQGFNRALVSIEVGASKEGLVFHFDYKGSKLKGLFSQAQQTVEQFRQETSLVDHLTAPDYQAPEKSFIAKEGVFGATGPLQLVLPNNPAFSALFSGNSAGGGSAAGGQAAAVAENFKVAKVWIEPGCIVCNACEDIYPEVFDVQASTCVVRPGAPLDNGLRIEEAAQGCPVEVIKFAR